MLEALTEPQLAFEVNIWTASSPDMCGLQEEYMRCGQRVSTHDQLSEKTMGRHLEQRQKQGQASGFSCCSVPRQVSAKDSVETLVMDRLSRINLS